VNCDYSFYWFVDVFLVSEFLVLSYRGFTLTVRLKKKKKGCCTTIRDMPVVATAVATITTATVLPDGRFFSWSMLTC